MVAAPALGRWSVLAGAALVSGKVGQTEGVLAAAEITLLALVVAGLVGAGARWSRPVLLFCLVVASLPLVRATALVGSVTVAGEELSVSLGLSRLQVPGLGVHLLFGLDLVPLALALWLVPLRPPTGRPARLPRWTWPVAAALAALSAVPTLSHVVGLGRSATVTGADAALHFEQAIRADGLTVACSETSGVLEGPLVRPFFLTVAVAEGDERPIVIIDRVDGASGSVDGPTVRFVPRDPLTPREVCEGLALSPRVETTMAVPPHF